MNLNTLFSYYSIKSVINQCDALYVINPKKTTPAVLTYTLRVITFALWRLYTNPSDWIKNKTVRRLSYFLVEAAGLEPTVSSTRNWRDTTFATPRFVKNY